MSVIRVCFLGTPEFAAIHLSSLIQDSHYEVVGVITQPDRPQGRKLKLTPSAVKILALANNIPVITSESLRKDEAALEQIKKWQAEVAIVVAFGQILSEEFLNSFPFGAVNVHGSLLPLWRGAAPIQRSLEAGDKVTGVALQRMVKKLDAGPVLGIRKIDLDQTIKADELYKKLANLGTELLQVELMDYLRGNLLPIEQDETQVTIAKKIEKEESLISFLNLSALEIHNKVRAFVMGPGTYFVWNGQRVKIHTTKYVNENSQQPSGYISNVDEDSIWIQTTFGQLILLEIQLESKAKMTVKNFLIAEKSKSSELELKWIKGNKIC